MSHRRPATAIVVGLALWGLVVGPAAASCALDPRPLEEQLVEAPVVFVGTVVDLHDQTVAAMTVDEVWTGDVPAEVVVSGGPGGPGVATSVDRQWHLGATYLVVPRVEGGRLVDDSCTPTREWTEELAALRPDAAHAPEPVAAPATTSTGQVPVTVLVAAAVVVTTAGLVVARRRRVPG